MQEQSDALTEEGHSVNLYDGKHHHLVPTVDVLVCGKRSTVQSEGTSMGWVGELADGAHSVWEVQMGPGCQWSFGVPMRLGGLSCLRPDNHLQHSACGSPCALTKAPSRT